MYFHVTFRKGRGRRGQGQGSRRVGVARGSARGAVARAVGNAPVTYPVVLPSNAEQRSYSIQLMGRYLVSCHLEQ